MTAAEILFSVFIATCTAVLFIGLFLRLIPERTMTYTICCEATAHNDDIEAESAAQALNKYLDGYRTTNDLDEPVPDRTNYSTLTIWLENDCIGHSDVFADGSGGVSHCKTFLDEK